MCVCVREREREMMMMLTMMCACFLEHENCVVYAKRRGIENNKEENALLDIYL